MLERLSGISKFCREQGALVGEGQCVSLMHAVEAMCVSLLQAVEAVAARSLDDATTLTAEVGSSAFSASQKDRLAKAISNKVTAGGAAARGEKPLVTQTFTSPLGYFSESDWDVFTDMRRTTQQVALRIAERLRMLNVSCLSEDSFAHLASLVAAARTSDASEVELFGIVLELKTACSGLVQAGGVVPFLWEFPVDPGNLPQALHDRAYSRESPVAKSLEHFRVLEQRCPRRKSHKALRGIAPQNARTPILMPAGSQSDAAATAPLANLVVQLQAAAAGQQGQVNGGDVFAFPGNTRSSRASSPDQGNRVEYH